MGSTGFGDIPAVATNADILPNSRLQFPTTISESGEIEATEVDISTMNNRQLLELIKRLDLKPNARNKASYVQTLRDFSADRAAWKTKCTPTAIRKHKGPRTSNTVSPRKHVKASALRREKLMIREGGMRMPCLSADVRSKDTRTEAQVEGLIDWARGVIGMPSYTPPPTPQRPSIAGTPSSRSAGAEAPSHTELSQFMHEVRCLLSSRCVTSVEGHSNGVSVQSNSLPAPISSNDAQTPAHSPNWPPGVDEDQFGRSPTGCATSTSDSCSGRVYSLRLAHVTIDYTAADIPDPPALSFVRDLAWLDRLWDDRSPKWDDSSPLRIRGQSIALVHWPAIYRYQGKNQWTGVKQRWFEWKALVVEYRALGPSAFWMRYSNNSKPLPITTILVRMKNVRFKEDCRLVALAKEKYGEDFDRTFSYRTRGGLGRRTLARPYAIARHYRKLHGLAPAIPVGEDGDLPV